MNNDELVFMVDLNQVEDEDLLPVSMKYTVNYGPGWLVTHVPPPDVGTRVRLYSGDDQELYYGRVLRVASKTRMIVQVDWDTAEDAPRTGLWQPKNLGSAGRFAVGRADAKDSHSKVFAGAPSV